METTEKDGKVTMEKGDFDNLRAGFRIDRLIDRSRKRGELMKLDFTSKAAQKKKSDLEEDADGMFLFKRQVDDSDPFITKYGKFGLLTPPYDFGQLYKFFEESDALQGSVDAMAHNIVGFGYQLAFLPDDTESNTPQAKEQKAKALNFLDQVNETESWTSLMSKVRTDYEVTGNAAIEIIRNKAGEVQLMYHIPINRVRMTRVERKAVVVDATLQRNGKPTTLKIKKRFRRFAQFSTSDFRQLNLRWFKEYGDPRVMDATTGEFMKKGEKPRAIASEVLWRKQDFNDLSYGLPRWIGAVLDVIGRRQASVVNFDLFQNQGIPPLAILTNGMLTEESLKDIKAMVLGARGVENWNKMLILEVTSEQMGLDDKGSNAKVEIKNLADFRKEDLMFKEYIITTGRHVRQSFRLPELYTGGGELTLTFASAKAAQVVAEEQVFIPERAIEAEVVNKNILQNELGIDMWAFKHKGPQIVGGAEISKGVDTFTKAGALSVNQSIQLANRLFGTEISPFKQKWADFPTTVVMELLKAGRLKDIGEIAEKVEKPPAPVTPPGQSFGAKPPNSNGKAQVPSGNGKVATVPDPTQLGQRKFDNIMKAIDDEKIWNTEELALYKKLRLIQSMFETADSRLIEAQEDI